MGFSLRQLRYFVAVAEAGQISAAARELYVSQSAVTTAVQGIERQLGHTVFERQAYGVSLTPTGRALLPKARQILEMVGDAETTTAGDDAVEGELRIGVSYTVFSYFLPHHVHQLSTRYPSLRIHWRELSRTAIERQILDGSLDFGLILTSNVTDDRIERETFVHSRRRLWMAPTHPLAGREGLRLADVAEHPYAMLTVDEAARTTQAYWGALQPQVFVRTSSIEACRSLVANGNAITILSDMVYRPWSLEGRRIDTMVLADPVPDMGIGLAWRRGATFTPAMRVLHDYFSSTLLMPQLPAPGT